jgi:NADH-quinone oxidoreductase subunit N
MASLAGVPPFGFLGQARVLRAAIEGGMLWLAIVGVVLRGDRCVLLPARDQGDVFRRARRRTGARAAQDRTLRVVFGVNALALLAFGLFWSPLMAWCQQAFA